MASLSAYLRDHGVKVHVLRNAPLLWGEKNLKADVPAGLTITDVNADQDFKGNGQIYVDAVKRVLDREPIDIIVYSVGPFYTLLTLRRIKKAYTHKQVVDFRDLWSYEQRGSKAHLTDLKYRLVQFLFRLSERPAVASADGIVVVTPGDAAIMRKHYPKQRQKIEVILNGYDEVAFSAPIKRTDALSLQLVSLGKLGYYAPHLAQRLFEALDTLELRDRSIKLVHVGPHEAAIESILPKVKNVTYECTGYVDYKQGLQIAYDSDVAVIVYNHPTGYGTKLFDYMAVNKPILLITDEAKDLSELVASLKNGFVCRSVADIQSAILTIVNQQINTLDDQARTQAYSRRAQNQRYLDYLRQLITSRSA